MTRYVKPDGTTLVLGSGVIGGLLVDLLAREKISSNIFLASRDGEQAYRRAMLAELVAENLGHEVSIGSGKVDLLNIDELCSLLHQLRPRIIVNTTSIQPWWVVPNLPPELSRVLVPAGLGPWLPMHLALTKNLMEAIKLTGISTCVVNCAYPDAVNPILARIGLPPSTGIGNIANPIQALRKATAKEFGCGPREIEISFVAHHYVSFRLPRAGDTGGAPSSLLARISGSAVGITEETRERIYRSLPTTYRRTRGIVGQIMTASSAATMVRALHAESEHFLHAPGPLGLIGGYPVKASSRGVTLSLDNRISIDEAVRINIEGQIFDGIERIDQDGRTIFTELARRLIADGIGFDCRPLDPIDALPAATEMNAKLRERIIRLGGKYPVALPG